MADLKIETEANIIKASILSGMMPVLNHGRDGRSHILLSNGKQNVFVKPYSEKGAAEFAVDLTNIANTLGISINDLMPDENLILENLYNASSVAVNAVVDNMYYKAPVKGYKNSREMDEDDARMKANAEKFPVANRGTEVGERFYIASKNLRSFIQYAQQIGVRPEITRSVADMVNERGSNELGDIQNILNQKVAIESIKKNEGEDREIGAEPEKNKSF